MAHLEIIQPRKLTRWERLKRSFTLGPYSIKNPPRDRELARLFGGAASTAGVHVDEDSSLGFAAVWNAVVLISQDVAKVPLPLYRRLPDGGKEPFREHQLYELLHDEPNEEMSSYVFRRTLQGHVLVWGNAFAEIERDGAGRPVALWPMMPWSVQPIREGNALRYRVAQPSGNTIFFDRRDVLHLSGVGSDGISGYPPIRKAMESIGLGVATERFGAAFFGNGATFGGIITYPTGIATNEQVRKENREVIEKRHQGVDRSHRLLTLFEGAAYTQMGIEPDKAQFLETRRFQIEEVARWFNIPVHKLKELARSTNNNIEHQGIEYATDTLQPWFRMWEGELRLKLISRMERKQQFFEHVTEALTRGDSVAQAELIGRQFSVGAITPNEIRSKFNMNPRADGNDIQLPAQTMPADLHRKYWEAQIEEATAKAEAARRPPPAPVVPGSSSEEETKSLREQLALARHAASLAEEIRDAAKAEAERERERAELVRVAGETTADELREQLAEANTSLHDAASREQALREQVADVERDRIAWERKAGEFCEKVTERTIEADAMKRERDEAQSEATNAMQANMDAEKERDAAIALADQTTKERDIALAEVGVMVEKVSTAYRERDEALMDGHRTAVELAAVRVTLEHAQRDLAIVRQEQAGAALALEVEQRQQRVQRAASLAAMRSLFVDASERLLYFEGQRARQNQATADKLRAWVDRFYPMHMEAVRQAFRPLVGAWTALAGGESDALLERLVTEHIEASRHGFARVLDAEDDDDRAALLERTLRRWETERAEAMADALVREGMGR